jgi:galactokinase
VHTAWQQQDVLGARMTGAGFGGCAIALVKQAAIPAFIKNVGQVYAETIGYEASFYEASIADGPHKITTTDLEIE